MTIWDIQAVELATVVIMVGGIIFWADVALRIVYSIVDSIANRRARRRADELQINDALTRIATLLERDAK